MSKVKKIVSVLLAAVMVLSASPLSFAYLDGYVAGTDFVYNPTSSVTNPAEIWVDTSGFSEIVRIADSQTPCLNGTTIVRANKAGIAETSMNFANFAMGNEAAEDYVLKMVIHGITDANLISNISISTSAINQLGNVSATKVYSSAEQGILVTWSGSSIVGKAVTLGGEGNIIWDISFTYASKQYTVHAYSYAKYVVRPNGLLTYIYCKPWIGDINGRTCVLSQLYCAQSIPGFYTTKDHDRCYLNNNYNVVSGKALSGCGKDDTGKGEYAVRDNDIGGMVARNWNFQSTNGEKDAGSFSHQFNGDRCVTKVYIDKSYDHLGKGNLSFNGKTLTNGLNMRICFKPGEFAGFWSFALQSIGMYQRFQGENDACLSQAPITSVGNTTTGTWTLDPTGKCDIDSSGNYNTGLWNERAQDGTGGWVSDQDVSNEKCFIMVPFGGSGALTSGTTWTLYYTVQNCMNNSGTTKSGIESGRRCKFTGWMSVEFDTYDTAQLRRIINAVDTGDGSNITSGGVTAVFTKGKLPQSRMYSSGWSAFETAYNNARMMIAKFNVTQTEIDNAAKALLQAYNGLVPVAQTGSFQVKHCLVNTTTELVPAQNFTNATTWANMGTGAAIRNGATFSVKGLVDSAGKCTLKGYKVSGASQIGGSVSFTTSGVEIKDDNGVSLGNCVTFYYEPANVTLRVHSGIYDSNTSQEYVYTSDAVNGSDLNSTSSDPNFQTIKNSFINEYSTRLPAHTSYAGMYSSSSYSGSPVDGINVSGGASTWNMPASGADVYIKWKANPVKLRVITSYGVTDTNVASAVTPTMAAQTYQMGAVTFNEPSSPPSQAGMSFVNYYTDDTYQTAVTWPITAAYDSQTYTITDGGDGYGYVTLYAKYVDRTNKIIFDCQGGTIADGTTVGDFTVNNNELNFAGATLPAAIGYPVPVKAGYIFTGWVTDLNSHTPVSGWTVTDASSETGVNYVEGGLHSQNNSTGFVCYATWKAAPIVITFKTNIPSSETAAINSTNLPGTNYYYQFGAPAGSEINTALFPSAPRRFGWTFAGWQYQGLSLGTNYDVVDMELVAKWERANQTAFAELTSYVTLAGEDEIVDIQHDEDNVANPTAQKGDVVKIRLSVAGNFYAGSSSYIFAYDADFFQAVSGVTASINDNNSYIAAIHAEATEINGATAYSTYHGMMDKTGGKVIDPGTGAQINNPAYIQVTVDPDVAQMTNGYKTVSFSDPTYIIEIVLKIKSNTTKQQASIWMPDELVRSGDNIMGDTYIAYSAAEASLAYVKTDTVAFDKEAVSTVKTQPDPRPTTSITLALPKDTNNNVLGQFADGRTAAKTFVGPEDTEIISTFTTDYVTYNETGSGTNVVGFPEPTRTGYHIAGWNKTAGSGSAATWDTYSFANADQNGNTYTVQWEADSHTLTFYKDETCSVVDYTKSVVYDQVGGITFTASQPRYNTEQYTFKGYIPKGMAATTENVVSWDNYTVTGDAEFYPWFVAAEYDLKIRPFYNTTNPDTGVVTTKYFGTAYTVTHEELMALTPAVDVSYGYTIIIEADSEVPAVSTWPVNTYYLKASDVKDFIDANPRYTDANKQNFVIKESVLPITITIGTTSPTVLVEMEGADVTVTFRAGSAKVDDAMIPAEYNGPNTATLVDGAYQWTITGKYGETYDFAAATAGVVAPFGYVKATGNTYNNGFDNAASAGTYQVVTHTATWVGAAVNVHWLNESGTDVKSASNMKFDTDYDVASNGPTAAEMEALKPGYTFSGWLVANPTTHQAINQTKVTTYNASDNPTGYIKRTGTGESSTYDMYFVPVYAVNSYNVIYKTSYIDVENSEVQYGEAESKEYGSNVTVNGAAPAVTGYTFDGWYNEGTYADKTSKVTSFTMGAEAKTLYGYYVPNTYKVRFYTNNGTDAYTDVDTAYNAAIVPPTSPEWANHVFKGWATTATAVAADKVTDFGTLTVTGDAAVKYYAIWETNYFVDYYFEAADTDEFVRDDSLTLSYTGTVGQSYSVQDADKTKGNRTGFSYSVDDSVLSGTLSATDGLRLVVAYKRNVNNFVKDIDGAVAIIGSYKYGATLPDVEAPTKTGYAFNGWNGMPSDGKMPDYQLVITATWTLERYTVKFDKNYTDAVNNIENVTVAYGGTIGAAMPTATRTGYDFLGWFTAATGGTQYTADTVFGDLGANGAELKLYAHWSIRSHTISFTNTGDSTYETLTYDYGEEIAEISDPTRVGHKFLGWSETVPETMPDRDLILEGAWKVEEYTVKFDANYEGAAEINNKKATFGETLSMPTVTREGYDFDGWYTAATGGVHYEDSTVFGDLGADGAELQLYAHWSINSYNITYTLAEGEKWADNTTAPVVVPYDYAETIAAQAAPVKTGYTFVKWIFKDADNVAYTGETMPAFNLTATASWKINQYTISFVENGGSEVPDITKNYGESVTKPADPTKAGYDFGGWYEDDEFGGSAYVFSTMPANDVTLYAKWNIHSYTVDFNMNGGTPQAESVTENYNETINLPSGITKTGYEFMGWFDNAGCTGDALGSTYTLPAKAENGAHITLYAKWQVKENTISFNSMGGNEVPSITQEYGTPVTPPADPERAGYDFLGWYENEDCSGNKYVFTTMPAESITLYAKWAKHEYTVVYLQPDDYVTYQEDYAAEITFADKDAFDTEYIKYADSMIIPEGQPDIIYYDFIGWYDELGVLVTSESLMPAASKNGSYYIYPHYEGIVVTIGELDPEGTVDIAENDVPPVDGYIYNAGNQKTKAQIKEMFNPTGYSDIVVTPLKGKYCGTGTKVEVIDLSRAPNEDGYVAEVYYMIVCGDVTGDAICRSNDLSIVEEMLAANEADRDWYVKDTVDDAEILRECFVLAADVNGDSIFDNNDAAAIECYVFGINDYGFNSEDKKYITVSKA